MNGEELKAARLRAGWTQEQTAGRLGVTQAYLSMAERGRRMLPSGLARQAVKVLRAWPTALPLREDGVSAPSNSDKLRAELATLGYPGFAHVAGPGVRGRVRRNPAEVLLNALRGSEVDTRVLEGLPWLAFTYADLDWDWAVRNAKLHDLQNRLGFVTTLAARLDTSEMGVVRLGASGLGESQVTSPAVSGQASELVSGVTSERGTSPPAVAPGGNPSTSEARSRRLKEYAAVLDRSRLAKEDTLCHDSLTQAERKWLRVNRPVEAAHWNLLTDMRAENLAHGRN
jgi:DNA-binding XRE family transcriptional regulator